MTDTEWGPCENCGTEVTADREAGVGARPGVRLWEHTGWIGQHRAVGEHTPGRCSAIRAGAPRHPFVGEAS